MKPLEYLHLQLRLEGREVVHGDLLRQVEVVPDEEMPLMVIALPANGQVTAYYDESLQPGLQNELARHIHGLKFPTIDPLLVVLKKHTIPVEVGYYKTYIFPASFTGFKDDAVSCVPCSDPQVQAFGFGGFPGPVYCIKKDEAIVSACVSTRENKQCAECWVYTGEEYRRQGFARRVVSRWGQAALTAGQVPFYSHKMENTASAALAKQLGLQPVFEEIGVSYMNV